MRVVVLYSRLSGYINACLRALHEQHDVELLVVRYAPTSEAPFDAEAFSWISNLYDRQTLSRQDLSRLVDDFRPDAAYVSGWFDRDYLSLARSLRRSGVPVVSGLDGQWKGTFRQHVARLTSSQYLHSAFDVLWAAGERQRQFAAKLGYAGTRCWSGLYACDWKAFASVYKRSIDRRPHAFLFVGRYVEAKGLDILIEGYRRYRQRTAEPWPLLCAGTGPLGSLLEGQQGVRDLGFIQPSDLPQLMTTASAFVLPSRHEPWGVVLQEAAAAGLPLVASTACGAAVHLLQDAHNGYLFESEDPEQLGIALERIAGSDTVRLMEMAKRSHDLSRQFTPERWARTFVEGISNSISAGTATLRTSATDDCGNHNNSD